MPFTVWGAFQKFRDDTVDLPAELTASARASRDFLYEQIKGLSGSSILSGTTVSFGSFARRTKMRPLDDIDCLAIIDCGKTTESYYSGYVYNIMVTDRYAALAPYADTSGYVNSTMVLNAVKKALESVSQYSKSEIGRNGSAVVLNLKSYQWAFDVVPACGVSGNGQTKYYLIPDGSGKWKRTDPRIDAKRAIDANAKHAGNFLTATRLLKYWNRRTHKPRLSSYYFETLLTNEALESAKYGDLQAALEDLLWGVRQRVLNSCQDPKGLGPNLDADVDYDTKRKVQDAAAGAWHLAREAISLEASDKHKEAIGRWRSIFGPAFPDYG